MNTDKILALVPAARINRVKAALEEFEPIINSFVNQVFDKLAKVEQRQFIKSESEYIKPISKISCYMRYGAMRYGRFGHSYICISNIELPESFRRKNLFTALLYALMAECQERKVILSVENPLEDFFQNFLLDLGFVCYFKDPFGLGTYYSPLKEGQISDEPFYNIEAYRNAE